ncbi:MAG TPA: ABC transporter permease [bacterium]
MRAIIWREIRLHYSKAYWLVSNFMPPFFYLLFFGYLFSAVFQKVAFENRNISYLHFFIPGLIVMQSFLTLPYALSLVNLDRRVKIIDMIHMTATSFHEYFSGRMISIQVLALVKAMILWVVAVSMMHMISAGVAGIVIALVVFVISTFIWFCVGFILGLVIKTEDARDIVMQFLALPLTFLSNIYYPVMTAPGLLKYAIAANPLTHATNLIRPALLNCPTAEYIGKNYISFLVLLAYFIVSGILALVMVRQWSAKKG